MIIMEKPNILICSFFNSNDFEEKLLLPFSKWSYPELFNNFSPNNVEEFTKKVSISDACIFILKLENNKKLTNKIVLNKNFIFYLGLCIGCIGINNTIVIKNFNINIEIPKVMTDINILEYDFSFPNLNQLSEIISTSVKEIYKKNKKESIWRKVSKKNLYNISEYKTEYYKNIIEQCYNQILNKPIIRKNWIINLKYNVKNDLITEEINWEYELINISNKKIEFPLSLIQIGEDINHLFSISTLDDNGKVVEIVKNVNSYMYNIDGIIKKDISKLVIEQNRSCFVHMYFEFKHYVSTKLPYVHNCLITTQSTLGVTFNVEIPKNYNFSLLGIDALKPHICEEFDDKKRIYYKIPYTLLPEQGFEYTIRKDNNNEKK